MQKDRDALASDDDDFTVHFCRLSRQCLHAIKRKQRGSKTCQFVHVTMISPEWIKRHATYPFGSTATEGKGVVLKIRKYGIPHNISLGKVTSKRHSTHSFPSTSLILECIRYVRTVDAQLFV
ncbi:hypothetical protein D918_07782 [Trichuris suis]|nr:hypothetical protein D918_07782 [Trichuris suis]